MVRDTVGLADGCVMTVDRAHPLKAQGWLWTEGGVQRLVQRGTCDLLSHAAPLSVLAMPVLCPPRS